MGWLLVVAFALPLTAVVSALVIAVFAGIRDALR